MNWSDLFVYEADSGRLRWKVTLSNRALAGSEAGRSLDKDGYRAVRVKGCLLRVHRVVFEMERGPIPRGMEIDHIDGQRSNNRLSNLRIVSRKENTKNARLSRRNTTGLHGVTLRKDGYTVSCAKTYIGHYTDFFEACCARKSAERTHGFHLNHGRTAS